MRLYENLYKSIAICAVNHLNAVNTGPVKRGQMTQIQNERFEQEVLPYRTKLFIGINVREIRKCQKLLKFKPLTFSSSSAICLKTTLEVWVLEERVHSGCDANLRPQGCIISYKSNALSLSYRAS